MMKKKQFIMLMMFLVALLVVLQIIHSVLLQYLEDAEMNIYEEPVASDNQDPNGFDLEPGSLLSHMSEVVRSNSSPDDSGEYHIVENVLYAAEGTDRDVTLAVHASVESLSTLPRTIHQWEGCDVLRCAPRQGPVSLAVLVTAELADEAALRLLALRLCVAGPLALHLVVPAGVQLRWPVRPPGRGALCRRLDSPPPARSYQLSAPYPNNLLRNVARRAARSQFVLSLDADMAPSVGLRRQFVALADAARLWTAPEPRTAYVLPLYEVGAAVAPPRDKTTLLELRRRWPGLLRPFYATACAKCQAPTDYARWEAAPAAGRLAPLYDVPWTDPWEPVYVLHRDTPLYDTRFRQFGFNRISHACELHVAGFSFRVLGDGFVLHLGLKGEDPPRPGQQEEQDRNRLLFRQFKQELKAKYPDSSRRC